MSATDVVPLSQADIPWLKDRVPPAIVDALFARGELVIDEEAARNYGRN